MGFGVSLLLSAVGAILIWAVNASVSGVNIHTIGWVLLIAGIVGFVLSLFLLESVRASYGIRRRTVDDVDSDRTYVP